jgi:predicted CXXCH cytochrome family protein
VDKKKLWFSSPLLAIVVAVVTFLFSHSPIDASAAGDNSAKQKPVCATEKCHAGMGKEKFVHGPIAAGDCTFCHVLDGKHKFMPITDVGKLCRDCHENLTSKQVVHLPVKQGNCTGCHDPHQSPNKFQLRAAGVDLCFLCHKRSIIGGKFVHGPVAAGSCSTCHGVHQSDFPKLLLSKGNQVCFDCHTDKADAFKGKKFTHAPVQDSCVSCHNPHSANYQFMFNADGGQELCFSCHDDKQKETGEATVKHKGLDTKKRCLACHDPHVADFARQLTMKPADLCMSCHDREYDGPQGHLMNMKDFLAKNKNLHGPIKQNDCSGCHNTHGSRYFRILKEYFPPLFYAGYNAENYKLCFMCHEKSLASEAITTTLTGFRNGDQNLHYVHVNKAVKGRTCRACHDAHATNNPKHVRDSVPFAKWNLPVGFVKKENGGQCLPGCHQMFGYDRKKAVKNK